MEAISHRALGTQGLSVSTIGLGCMSLSGVYGPADDAELEKLIQYAIDRGIDHLDSSDMYGWGHNEEVLGRAIKGRRDRVVLVTKFGQTRREGQANGVDGSPQYVQQACEASLKRLGVDVIDVYYQHRVDPSVPIEDTVGAMAGLVRQGKVRFLGLSEARPETIRRAHEVHPISAVQTEYSLLYRTEAEETRKTTRELGIGFVAYSPLGRGFLTGAIKTSGGCRWAARSASALSGRQFCPQPGLGCQDRGDGRGERLHACADYAGLAAGTGSRRRRHPRHPLCEAAG